MKKQKRKLALKKQTVVKLANAGKLFAGTGNNSRSATTWGCCHNQ